MRRAVLLVSASLWLCLWAPAPALSQEAETTVNGIDIRVEEEDEKVALVSSATTEEAPAGEFSVQVVEENWTIVLQPRCCSDCTFVSRGFKCKVKSCLSNCPWARSSATPSAVPLF